jgi:hypothetical protein
MDVQALLEPMRQGPVPDVELVHARVTRRRRRRRALFVTGCVAVVAVLGTTLWLAPRNKSNVATVGDAKAEATSQVRHVIETLFLEGPSLEEKLAQIDDPTGLDSVVAQGMQDDRAHRLTLTIAGIDINDPTAVAHIDFFLDGMTAMPDGRLELTHNGDGWLATRDSYCALIETGGLHCPTTGAPINPDETTVITTHLAPPAPGGGASLNEGQRLKSEPSARPSGP